MQEKIELKIRSNKKGSKSLKVQPILQSKKKNEKKKNQNKKLKIKKRIKKI